VKIDSEPKAPSSSQTLLGRLNAGQSPERKVKIVLDR
jgi:hypothetical protein